MKDGFIKAAAVTPGIRVADPEYNAQEICGRMDEAMEAGSRIVVFPELCLTGYTCGDLFLQELLLKQAGHALMKLVKHSKGRDALILAGLPVEREGMLYNAAAAFQDGKLLAMIPKSSIPAYSEFYEGRHFREGNREPVPFCFHGMEIPFGTDILFEIDAVEGLTVAAEICEDLWVPDPPSTRHALAGATVIANLSASNETIGKDAYRNMLVKAASARLISGYVYAGAGEGESTTDLVFGGHDMIAENGTMLAEVKRFLPGIIYGDLDIQRLRAERRRIGTFSSGNRKGYQTIRIHMEQSKTVLHRAFGSSPFVPSDEKKKAGRCEEVLSIQSAGLKKRLSYTGCGNALVGISGGLDSTLALLATVRSFDLLNLQRGNIRAVTMPCFGTTDRTYQNACKLVRRLGAELIEIDIRRAVKGHFEDIGHDPDVRDVTYENSQARERTQVLMDLANQTGGLLVGTGDMSELALGFTTYNGDHMSMYGVNAGVPKTLVRHLVRYYADSCNDKELSAILLDILDTPVSPELLPPEQGKIAQKTEEVVGPYELHDFFLYYMMRFGFEPAKIFRIAKIAFEGVYDDDTIRKWLKTFYRRFFSQQFKRSCLPDGPKVGSVALSPRGDWRMPSDASAKIWLNQIGQL